MSCRITAAVAVRIRCTSKQMIENRGSDLIFHLIEVTHEQTRNWKDLGM